MMHDYRYSAESPSLKRTTFNLARLSMSEAVLLAVLALLTS